MSPPSTCARGGVLTEGLGGPPGWGGPPLGSAKISPGGLALAELEVGLVNQSGHRNGWRVPSVTPAPLEAAPRPSVQWPAAAGMG